MQKNLLSFIVDSVSGKTQQGVLMNMKLVLFTIDVGVTIPKTCGDGGMLSAVHTLEKKANQQYLFKLIQKVIS